MFLCACFFACVVPRGYIPVYPTEDVLFLNVFMCLLVCLCCLFLVCAVNVHLRACLRFYVSVFLCLCVLARAVGGDLRIHHRLAPCMESTALRRTIVNRTNC